MTLNGVRARFWSKVRVNGPGDCWEWSASTKPQGYGQFHTQFGGIRRTLYAHRTSWELPIGPVPPGLSVLHRCDNRRCCNPCHLFLGTDADNAADKAAKGRARRKLSDADVRRVRDLRAAGHSLRSVAATMGIDKRMVWSIHARETWGWLQ